MQASPTDRPILPPAQARSGAEPLEHVTSAMSAEVLPSRIVATVLRSATAILRADGAAAVTVTATGPAVYEATSAVPPPLLSHASQGLLSPCIADDTLACPVPDRLGPPAVLLVWREMPGTGWAEPAPALAASLARLIGTVLEQDALQAELLRQSRTDPLTGLLTRRAFLDDLDRRLARAQVVDGSGVLIVLDIDGLERINDRHGPEAGDDVLAATATLLRRTFRPADLLARLHGDEFAAWLDGADALSSAERVHELCGTLPDATSCVLPEAAGPVTMSAGVAVADCTVADLEELLRRAEVAMSVAKGTGGGAWQVDGGGLPRPGTRP